MSGRPPEELAAELDAIFLNGTTGKNQKSISVETLVDAFVVLYDECCNSSLRREKTVTNFIEYGEFCANGRLLFSFIINKCLLCLILIF